MQTYLTCRQIPPAAYALLSGRQEEVAEAGELVFGPGPRVIESADVHLLDDGQELAAGDGDEEHGGVNVFEEISGDLGGTEHVQVFKRFQLI